MILGLDIKKALQPLISLDVDICSYTERTVEDNFVSKGLPSHVRDEGTSANSISYYVDELTL